MWRKTHSLLYAWCIRFIWKCGSFYKKEKRKIYIEATDEISFVIIAIIANEETDKYRTKILKKRQ